MILHRPLDICSLVHSVCVQSGDERTEERGKGKEKKEREKKRKKKGAINQKRKKQTEKKTPKPEKKKEGKLRKMGEYSVKICSMN